MQSRAIEVFYLLFQGVLVFQVLVFAVLYFITRRKDLLYYSLFLFFAAAYFFINAPYTFFGVPEEVVWNSSWYDYFNTPTIIIENLFYLLFLKVFFADITKDRTVTSVLAITYGPSRLSHVCSCCALYWEWISNSSFTRLI